MKISCDIDDRRSVTEQVFDQLHEEIVSLKLLPGAKLSEVEVARKFGVSPQPVRDAFYRLRESNLLVVRPQRATRVRGFSIAEIKYARFVRLSIELEVLQRACDVWDESRTMRLLENLERQKRSVEAVEPDRMRLLDYEFHRLICELSGCPFAYETIKSKMQKVSRVCELGLTQTKSDLRTTLGDHLSIAHALETKSVDSALCAARNHFSRLDDKIDEIYVTHTEYFEAD